MRDDQEPVFDVAHRDDQHAAAGAIQREMCEAGRIDGGPNRPPVAGKRNTVMMLQFEEMRILNADQMREADRRTIQDIGIASLVLMENAGRQVVAAVESLYSDLAERSIAIVCGKGNNGGDGFVVARTLQQRGFDVSVFVIGRISEVKGDARINLDILGRIGQTVVEVADETAWELHGAEIAGHDLIIDAMFGIGLSAPLTGFYETVVADINEAGVPIVSIDIPSGMSADSADLIGDAIEATVTVTLGRPENAAGVAARRVQVGRGGDCRHRYSRRRVRPTRRAAARAPDARADASADPAARGRRA